MKTTAQHKIKFQRKLGNLDFSMDSVAPRALEEDFRLSKHKHEYLNNLDTLLVYQVCHFLRPYSQGTL